MKIEIMDYLSERIKDINLLKKMQRQIRVNGGQHAATQHYMSNYGYVPLWIVVKVLSFGIISELFSILKPEDQRDMASIYNLSPEDLCQYFPIMSNYRNLCAHEDILFDHRSQRVIEDNKYHYYLNIPKMNGEYIYGKDDLFALIIILRQILRNEDFRMLVNEISYELDILEGKLQHISIDKVMDAIGFPKNYKEIVRMDI